MIFVCVGSREYPFDRLFKELDRLVEQKQITDQIFAQIGTSQYIPKHFKHERFLDRESFSAAQDGADLIIAHAGAGTLIAALKKGKKVIAVPRLAAFGEHIDDHQLQISTMLADEGYLLQVRDINMLGPVIQQTISTFAAKPYQHESRMIDIVRDFLNDDPAPGKGRSTKVRGTP